MKLISLLFIILISNITFASNIKLIARANTYNSFNLPDISYITNSTITHNSNGDIAFNFIAIIEEEVRQCIWLRNSKNQNGSIIHMAKVGNFLSDPSINALGEVTFSEYNETQVLGLFRYSILSHTTKLLLDDQNGKYIGFRDPQINNDGDILFRLTHKRNHKSVVVFREGLLKTIVDQGDQGISYLFGAKFTDSNKIILKTREGSRGQLSENRPDTLRLYSLDGSFNIVNDDHDSSKDSLFSQFNNTPGANSQSKYFSFIAKLKNGKKGLVRQLGAKYEVLVVEGERGIKTLEYFSPSINSKGNIAFRAIDTNGIRNVFWTNGRELKSMVKKGDLVDTDVTTATIFAPRGPSFGGGITINELDEVVFLAKIYTKYQEEDLGSAVLKATF